MKANSNVSGTAYVNHLCTNYANYHYDTWATTHNANGYPFSSINGSVTTSSWTADDGPWIGIDCGNSSIGTSNGGDMSDTDNIHFLYANNSLVPTTAPTINPTTYTWTAFIANANSHINNWAKCAIIARADCTTNNCAYFGIIVPADDNGGDGTHAPRSQYRTSSGSSMTDTVGSIPSIICETVSPFTTSTSTMSNTGGITNDYRFFIKATFTWNGANTVCTVYGSQNGVTYTQIDSKTITGWLGYQGISASSHDSGNNFNDGKNYTFGFSNLALNGTVLTTSNFTATNIGSDSGYQVADNLLLTHGT